MWEKRNDSDPFGWNDRLHNFFTDEERSQINTLLPYLRDWTVQAGAEGMNASDTQNRGAFLLGGNGSDVLTGGTSADLLVGNAGDDQLTGGEGNDILLGCSGNDNLKGDAGNDLLLGGKDNDTLDGGAGNDILKGGEGNDTYTFTGTYGTDIVTDSDGSGTINVDGKTLGSATLTFESIYRDATSGQTIVRLNGGNSLVILKEGSTDRILVNDWSTSKALGITLQDNALDVPTATLSGDFKKATNGNDYVLVNGNYVSAGVEANALELISGTAGNDAVFGEAGDDGAANDYIYDLDRSAA